MRHISARGGVLLVVALAGGCSSPSKIRAEAGIRPTYDTSTGQLKELTLDSNRNGRIDTWTEMDGARPIQTRIDRNEDGRLDRWEYYDTSAQLVKVGFSRKDDGKPDGWAYSGADGRIQRIEISSVADENTIDRWEQHDGSGLVSAEEDTNADGVVDKWETYRGGALSSAAFDEDRDGKPDRRMTYDAGALVSIETGLDASGKFTKRVDAR